MTLRTLALRESKWRRPSARNTRFVMFSGWTLALLNLFDTKFSWLERFSSVEKPKPKQLLRPITTRTNRAVNQSQFLAITGNTLEARKKSRVRGRLVLVLLLIGWKTGASLLSQSLSVAIAITAWKLLYKVDKKLPLEDARLRKQVHVRFVWHLFSSFWLFSIGAQQKMEET